MSLIDKKERASQLARAIATDLLVYHEKEIKEGIENDHFFSVMHDLLEEGRLRFQKRVSKELWFPTYDHAIIDVMIKSQSETPSVLW